MNFLTLLLLILVNSSLMAGMKEKAKKEGWTFHFNEAGHTYQKGFYPTAKHLLKEDTSIGSLDVAIPQTFDLRATGKITPIQNQGNCGSCWAFSLVAVLSDALSLSNDYPGPLSQQYLVDCANDMYGCQGGMFEAANWLKTPRGAPLLSTYPYTAKDGNCRLSRPAGSLIEWAYIGSTQLKPSTVDLQKAILTYGAISVDVAADNNFVSYESGIYNACSSTRINHMTALVGWDNEGTTADNTGKYPVNKGYWIMRNSWGKEWGEDGYMRIKYTGRNGRKCNAIADEAIYVKVDGTPLPPPVISDFSIDGKTITVKGSLKHSAKYKVDEAKKDVQMVVDDLDKK